MRRWRRSGASLAVAPAAALAIAGVVVLLGAMGVGNSAPAAPLSGAPSPVRPAPPPEAPASVALPSASPAAPPAAPPASAADETAASAPVATRAPDDLLRYVSKTSEPLPPEYVPPDLVTLPPGLGVSAGVRVRAAAFEAFVAMAAAARREGILLVAVSGYRSYATQAAVYQQEVALYGKTQADRQVALPGRSEHQLGTAIDVSLPSLGFALDDYLGDTREGRWLEAHAWEYGFILSYPPGKEEITGYRFEPWHYRYLGLDAARFIRGVGLTITEVLHAHQSSGDVLIAVPPAHPHPTFCDGLPAGEGC